MKVGMPSQMRKESCIDCQLSTYKILDVAIRKYMSYDSSMIHLWWREIVGQKCVYRYQPLVWYWSDACPILSNDCIARCSSIISQITAEQHKCLHKGEHSSSISVADRQQPTIQQVQPRKRCSIARKPGCTSQIMHVWRDTFEGTKRLGLALLEYDHRWTGVFLSLSPEIKK